jgi:DNA-binding beta-propeller fold protein YncE
MKFSFLKKFVVLAGIATMVVLQSCHKDSDPVVKVGAAGFFVVNEGSFGAGNTSISYYDRAGDAIANNIFAVKNGRRLGDQAQSMAVFEGKGYIVVENSSTIEVINADDFSSIASITDGIESPRYFIGISSSKAYVSDWGFDGITGTVKVIDLTTNKVTKTIVTGKGSNRMLKINNLVYIANAGGYDKDNTVKIIDTNTDAIVNSITTGDNPNSLQRDKDGNIWVTSSGALAYNDDFSIDEVNSTKGSISKLTSAGVEVFRLSVPNVSYSGPANLGISPDAASLYYAFDGSLYKMSTTATDLPSSAFKTNSYYGVAIDPFNGNVIGCNAPNFSAAGSIDIFDADGNLIKTYTVGIAPNDCAFK